MAEGRISMARWIVVVLVWSRRDLLTLLGYLSFFIRIAIRVAWMLCVAIGTAVESRVL